LLQHVLDHKGSIIRELYTVLGYNYSNGSIVSVDMDVVSVMAAYLPMVHVCTASLDCAVHTHTHTHTMDKYAAIILTTSVSMDEVEPLL